MTAGLALRSWRISAVAVTGVILVVLLLPGHRLPVAATAGLDKLVHLGSYVLVGLTWHRAGLRARWVLVLGAAMAVGTEVAQEVMPWGRQADALDLVANGAGLALGVGASLVLGGRGDDGRQGTQGTEPG